MFLQKNKPHNSPAKWHSLLNLNRTEKEDQKTIDLQFRQDIKLLRKEVRKIENRQRAAQITYLATTYILAGYIEKKVGRMIATSLEKSVY